MIASQLSLAAVGKLQMRLLINDYVMINVASLKFGARHYKKP